MADGRMRCALGKHVGLQGECRAGLRNLIETMLTGQILVHWDFLCSLLGEKGTSLMRCELMSGAVLIGLMIPRASLATWLYQLASVTFGMAMFSIVA